MKVEIAVLPVLSGADLVTVNFAARGTDLGPRELVRDVALGLRDRASTLRLGPGSPLRIQVDSSFGQLAPTVAAVAAWQWGRGGHQLVVRAGSDYIVGDTARLALLAKQHGLRLPASMASAAPLQGNTACFEAALRVVGAKPANADLLLSPADQVPELAAKGWVCGFLRPNRSLWLAFADCDLLAGCADVLRLGSARPLVEVTPAPAPASG